MSTSNHFRKMVSFLVVLTMVIGLVPANFLFATTVNETIAEWNWTAYPTFPANATGGRTTEATLGVAEGILPTGIFSKDKSISTKNWQGGGKYWILEIPKNGYSDLELSFSAYGSKTGPKEFKVQVSNDNNQFYDVTSGSYNLGEGPQKITIPLNTTEIDINQAGTVYVRLINTSTVPINGITVANTGTSRLYDVTLRGNREISEPSKDHVSPVTANPAGGTVPVGTQILLETQTTGAAIYYSINNSERTTGSAITLNESDFIGNPATATVKAIATKEGFSDSDEATFTYTKQDETPLDVITIVQARPKKNEVVTVEGIVTRAIQSSATSKTSCTVFIQDETGGIGIFKSGIAIDDYPIGTKVKVKGTISDYNGVIQVQPAALTDIEVIAAAGVVPRTPEKITIATLNTLVYEGKLVEIEGITLDTVATNSNHNIVDPQTNAKTVMRYAESTTLPESFKKGDTISIIGIAANFKGTPQILVSKVGDITQGPKAPVEPVQANPDTGSQVPLGGTINLSTITEGATITYTVNGGSEQQVPNSTASVMIPAFDQEGQQAVIKAKAAKTGYTTPEKTFFYTQARVPKVITSLPVGAVKPGSQVKLTATPATATISYIVTKKVGSPEESSDPEAVYKAPIILTQEMLPVKITAWAKAPNYLDSERAEFNYRLQVGGEAHNYFGQLHSHTAENSDGAGTLVEAYEWARDRGNLDFFAVTDHSNSFDTANTADKAGTYNLGAYNAANEKWQNGKRAAAESCREDFLGVYAYEMTWSGGPGHMNTFNTEGFVSRNNKELNNKAGDAGLKAYYELLKQTPSSITQFNHPGKTFGTFSGFAYRDPVIDQRISLIEVGNGEGQVGSGGYFASYNEYNQALDKGWHLAPTNNQDNHKKEWGTANTARTVIYTSDFTVDGMYQALRDMRVYATEDNNLDIVYTLNGEPLGTIMSTVPESAQFNVTVNDPDASDAIASIAIISNGGKTVYTQNYAGQNAVLDYTIAKPKAGYYYIKVVQADGHIAVTAPIWLGEAAAVGITEVSTNTTMPVTSEELTVSTELFNNEKEAAVLKSIKYQLESGEVIADIAPQTTIGSNQAYVHTQKYVPTRIGKDTVLVTAVMTIGGEERTYTGQMEWNVRDVNQLVFVGIDASHYNEYVAGNYKNSMGNFAKLAAQYDVRTVELRTSDELIAAMKNPKYQMMVFTAPSRRDGTTGRIPYANYSDEEVKAVADFAKSGGTVIVAGWADYYESYSNIKNEGLANHMAGQQNRLLEAIGSALRISDDGALDDKNNGGQAPRLYLTDYNKFVSPLTKGIKDGQVYSNYGGATIYAVNGDGTPAQTLPTSVMPVISGHDTTYSKDQDGDGVGFADKTMLPPRYNDKVLITATETLAHQGNVNSQVIVSGAAFMSNFEIQAEVENAGSLNYSNYNILENIIKSIQRVTITPISEVKKAPVGTQFTIEGTATTSVYNGSNSNKGFFDCIYVQDATGGINLFPVAQGVTEGQKIRVTGTVSAYQGETQLLVSRVQVIDETTQSRTPQSLSTQAAMNPAHTGELIKVKGKVKSVVKDEAGVVGQIIIDDGTGPALLYINGYITKDTKLDFVTVGKEITAVGLASIGENFQSVTDFLPRLRIRDRGEITPVIAPPEPGGDGNNGSKPGGGGTEVLPTLPNIPVIAVQGSQTTLQVVPSMSGTQGTVAMSISTIADVVKAAEAQGSKTMIIQPTAVAGMTGMTFGLQGESLRAIAQSRLEGMTMITPMGSLGLDSRLLDTLAEQAKGDVKINFVALETKVGERPTYEFSITSDGKPITSFGEGIATIRLPYGLRQNEKSEQVVVYYLKEDGTREVVKNAHYDDVAKVITFGTGHFSKYSIGYGDVQFEDVADGAWYRQAVDYVAAREIITGIEATKFAPEQTITRAQFLVMLMRAYDITPQQESIQNFADAGNTYYTPYLATAKAYGFVKGDTNNCFSPNAAITRQDMFVMLYHVLAKTGNMPKADTGKELGEFVDQDQIANYAQTAVLELVKAGVITGNNGQIEPKASAIRAYGAQIIYNLYTTK